MGTTPLDSNGLKYMEGLRFAVIKHMERTIAKARKDAGYNDEYEKFYRYVESIMTSSDAGKWYFTKEDASDYPFSPVYGIVFVFEYEGETMLYGWDKGRFEIGFYILPKHLCLSSEAYIRMEDILNEAISLE